MATARHLRKRLPIMVACAVVMTAFVAALTLSFGPLKVRYHEWRMRANLAAHYSQEPSYVGDLSVITAGAEHRAYENHRDCLVGLGILNRHEYVYSHLHRPSPEATHMEKWLLTTRDPRFIDWVGAPIGNRDEPLSFTFWCYPADSEACLQLLRERDVENYADVHMAGSGE
jgi:hypothetical protein